MSLVKCPDRDTLLDYIAGKLSDDDSDSLAEHLESCPECREELAAISDADDTLINLLRDPADTDPLLEESACVEAIRRAKQLDGIPTPNDEMSIQDQLGEYRLIESIGSGGMGKVYKALHKHLDRIVAVKVLPHWRADDSRAVERFECEMKAIGRLDHPHVVRAYDAREIDGRLVLIMEYVEGLDLAKVGRYLGRLDVADACEIARQAALGLQVAHEHGLVHRDVKPSNLMLTPEGQVKLLDLGLARLHGGPSGKGERRLLCEAPGGPFRQKEPVPFFTENDMTDAGQAMGTADYMAPEQTSDSRTADIRADIYGLGATFYRLLAGRAPFDGPEYRGSFDKMLAHRHEPVPPCPNIPNGLAVVLDRMLAKSPDDRYSTPAEAAEALAPWCEGADLPALLERAMEAKTASTLPLGECQREGRSSPQPLAASHGWRFIATMLVLLLLIGGLGFAAGIMIRIKKDGRETAVEVPEGSTTRIDSDGNVNVDLSSDAKHTSPASSRKEQTPHDLWLEHRITEVANELAGQKALLERVGDLKTPIAELDTLVANDPIAKQLHLRLGLLKMEYSQKTSKDTKAWRELQSLQKQYGQRLDELRKKVREKERSLIEKEIVHLTAQLASLRKQQKISTDGQIDVMLPGHATSALGSTVVSGKVSVDGQPIESGYIAFVPLATGAGSRRTYGTAIRKGKYEVTGPGGPPEGTYRVEITAFQSNKPGGAKHQYLPPKYNTKSALTISVLPGSSPQTLDFDLQLDGPTNQTDTNPQFGPAKEDKKNDATLNLLRRNTARLLVDQVMLIKHWEGLETNKDFISVLQDLSKKLSRQKADWRLIKPDGGKPAYAPRDQFEWSLLDRFKKPETPGTENNAERLVNDNNTYQYYQPIYAEQSCIACHQAVALNDPRRTTDGNPKHIAEGDLMSIICINLPANSGIGDVKSQNHPPKGAKYIRPTGSALTPIFEHPKPAVNPAAELKALLGQWKVVAIEKGRNTDAAWGAICGFDSPMNPTNTIRLDLSQSFEGVVLRFMRSKPELVSSGWVPPGWTSNDGGYSFKIDPTVYPKRFDLIGQDGVSPYTRRAPDNMAAVGIYKLDGGRLKIRLSRYLSSVTGDQRPKDFSIKPDSADIAFTLERYTPHDDEKKIKSNWSIVKRIIDGKPNAENSTFVFNEHNGLGRSFINPHTGEVIHSEYGYFILNPSAEPKRITMYERKQPVPGRLSHLESEWILYSGIYILDDDRLTIACRQGDKPPEKFESKPGSGVKLLELRRTEKMKPIGPPVYGAEMGMAGGTDISPTPTKIATPNSTMQDTGDQ